MMKTLLASLALATIASSASAGDKPAACGAVGTACRAKRSACGSPAAKRHAVLKKVAKTASCCTPGSACCAGGACCAKKA